jgi:hypothetical protein
VFPPGQTREECQAVIDEAASRVRIEHETAERIAAWLEATVTWTHRAWPMIKSATADIRSGAWRRTEGESK